MRIAGNKVRHLRDFYFAELRDLHEPDEINALFREACMHYLGWTATQVLSNAETNLNQSDLLKIYDCAKALREGQPLQYILKTAWFMGHDFVVSPAVLIPRPETEELVELFLKNESGAKSFLDIGTGSGCIPLSIAIARPHAIVTACDISPAALDIARQNATKFQTEITFLQADVLQSSFSQAISQTFDVIISNPPYIKYSEKAAMSPHVTNHEPHQALFVEGEDDISFYRAIISHCPDLLNKGGSLYFELNPLTSEDVLEVARNFGIFSRAEIIKDLSGKARFLFAKRLP